MASRLQSWAPPSSHRSNSALQPSWGWESQRANTNIMTRYIHETVSDTTSLPSNSGVDIISVVWSVITIYYLAENLIDLTGPQHDISLLSLRSGQTVRGLVWTWLVTTPSTLPPGWSVISRGESHVGIYNTPLSTLSTLSTL